MYGAILERASAGARQLLLIMYFKYTMQRSRRDKTIRMANKHLKIIAVWNMNEYIIWFIHRKFESVHNKWYLFQFTYWRRNVHYLIGHETKESKLVYTKEWCLMGSNASQASTKDATDENRYRSANYLSNRNSRASSALHLWDFRSPVTFYLVTVAFTSNRTMSLKCSICTERCRRKNLLEFQQFSDAMSEVLLKEYY